MSTVVVMRCSASIACCSASGVSSKSGTSTPGSRSASYLPPVAAADGAEVELGRDPGVGERRLGAHARVHVIGMLVKAPVVVGDQDLRPVLLDQARQPGRHLSLRDVAERVGTVLVLPFRHAGVVVTEQLQVRDAQDGARLAQLSQALLGHCLLVVPVLPRLDAARAVPEFAVRAGHDHRPDALRGVGGQHAAGARRLVIGVGVDRHHRQLLCHDSSLPDRRPDRPIGVTSR